MSAQALLAELEQMTSRAREIVRALETEPRPAPQSATKDSPEIVAVFAGIERVFGVSRSDIVGRRRFAELTEARMAAALAMHRAGIPACKIEPALARGRSDVLYLIKRGAELERFEDRFAEKLGRALA